MIQQVIIYFLVAAAGLYLLVRFSGKKKKDQCSKNCNCN
jgi:hypothetical protein